MYRNRNTQCLKKCVSYKLHKIIVHMFTILHVSLQFYQHDMYNSTLVLLLFSTFYTFYFLHMYVVCVCVHTHTHPLCRVSSQYTSTTYYTHTLYYTRIGSLHVMYVELLHYVHCRSCRIQCCSTVGGFSASISSPCCYCLLSKSFSINFGGQHSGVNFSLGY